MENNQGIDAKRKMRREKFFMSTREAAKKAGYSARHLQNFITSESSAKGL